MEYVKFKNELKASALKTIAIDLLGSPDKFIEKGGNNPFSSIVGVSDGRYAAKRTLCFIDRSPNQEIVERLAETFIITNKDIAH
jgi:hypothetical protein